MMALACIALKEGKKAGIILCVLLAMAALLLPCVRSIFNYDGNTNNTASFSFMTKAPESDRVWHQLKNKMCPDMTPNPKVWSTLFELARAELGFAKHRIPENPKDENFTKLFFTFNSGGAGFSSPDGMNHVVYLRVWKAGNDVIRKNLMNKKLYDKGSNVWDEHGRGLKDIKEGWPSLWSPIPTSQLNQTCVVTAVRDPISHFLSGYNEMEYRVAAGDRGHTWDTQRNPRPMIFHRFENGTIARFEQFVADFVGGAASSSGIFPSMPYWNIYHVFSMTGVLWGLKQRRNLLGEDDATPRLTAYLPSISDLSNEFPKFLMENCKGLPPKVGDPWVEKREHPSQRDVDGFGFHSAAKHVWSKQDATARALCVIHALDYACYDDIPIPSLCQSVYSKQHFRDGLFAALAS